MKKLLKDNIKILIAIVITSIVTATTTIFAYSLIAETNRLYFLALLKTKSIPPSWKFPSA